MSHWLAGVFFYDGGELCFYRGTGAFYKPTCFFTVFVEYEGGYVLYIILFLLAAGGFLFHIHAVHGQFFFRVAHRLHYFGELGNKIMGITAPCTHKNHYGILPEH